jgi:hypothetical protein
VGPTALLLCIDNTGSRHGKITIHSLTKQAGIAITLVSESDLAALDDSKNIHYVLSGAHREMRLNLAQSISRGDRLLLSVDVNAKRQDISLTVQ